MITYAIMGAILLLLAFLLLYKAEYTEDTNHFFDLTNTTAMRGFWCLIVILVHIPAAYQNRIQDMIGSFAYIGVTFFFMTSAYGLKIGAAKNPDSIKIFWRRRLPKLLVPMLLVNILGMIMSVAEGKEITWHNLISINAWVLWLLACYFIYWIVNRLILIRGGVSRHSCMLDNYGNEPDYIHSERKNYNHHMVPGSIRICLGNCAG